MNRQQITENLSAGHPSDLFGAQQLIPVWIEPGFADKLVVHEDFTPNHTVISAGILKNCRNKVIDTARLGVDLHLSL